MTFGNAKAIDLLAHNAETGESFAVQVKALRANNYFLLDSAKVVPTQVYVFVLLGKPRTAREVFHRAGRRPCGSP